jgi:type II secretory pathway component PulF
MPTFHYTGYDEFGQSVSGTIKSLSEAVARHTLAEEQRVHVEALRPAFFSRGWGTSKPNPASVVLFTRWTASLLRSLTLQESLEVTRDDLGDPRMERVLWDISVHVKRGRPFADALAEHPKAFSRVYVAAVRAGEHAGLQEIMRMLAISQKRSQETRRKIMKGLAYPATVLGIGILVTLVILYVVVPRFATAVADAGAEAPLIMRMMLGASHVLRFAGPALLLLLGALAWLAVRGYRSKGRFRDRVDTTVLRTPVLGNLIRQSALAGWARLFAILYTSGTSVSTAVALAGQTISNQVLQAQLAAVAEGHNAGRPLWQEMKRVGIPPITAKMTQVGEEGGRLAEMMTELADYYDEETSYSVDKLTAKLEPLAIVVIMIPVALLVAGVMALMQASMQAVIQ